ncbi:hypothetical protein PHMEG_00020507 [Phytophthora megakarya]|uniref:MULE transposase domain-containing protein n=1 Tax=Phytophthora megakarya TaxID=4795 RepID=A0A225VNL6_9STRA|nr:hypothetical protein PHMEG_00020507 [Phytophthora megakarya]
MFIDTEVRLPRWIVTDRDLACMNATDTVFPSTTKLICRWHVNRNVEARVRRILGEVTLSIPDLFGRTKMNTHKTNVFVEEYHAAAHAETEEEYEACRRVLRQMDSSLADYLDSTWWRYKEELVKCWTNTHLHYGYLDTDSRQDKILAGLFQRELVDGSSEAFPWWKTAANSVSFDAQRELSKVSYKLTDPTSSNVVKVITSHASTETHTVRKKAVKYVHDSFKTHGHQAQLKPYKGIFDAVTIDRAYTK